MFKPHYGTGCPDCPPDTKALIVVKSGYCQRHNEDRKKEKKALRKSINEPKIKEAERDLEKISTTGFKPHYGTCSCGCGKDGLICVRKGYIQQCNQRIKNENKKQQVRIKPIIVEEKKFKEPTGELKLFKIIWQTRPHRCEVCDKEINEFSHNIFSHILPKGLYPEYRLDENNIWIMCHDFNEERGWGGCHFDWGNFTDEMKSDPKWIPVFELAEALRQETNNKDI